MANIPRDLRPTSRPPPTLVLRIELPVTLLVDLPVNPPILYVARGRSPTAMADEFDAARGDRAATRPQVLIQRRSGISAGGLGDLLQP